MLEALTRAGVALAGCADIPAWALPDADVVACLDAVTLLASQAAAVRAVLVHQVETRAIPAREAATSTTAWLRGRYRVSPQAARRAVALAAAVDASPRLATALAGGVVNPEQAAVIHDCRTRLPADAGTDTADRAEAMLIDLAAQFDPLPLRRLGQRILAHVDPDLDDRVQAEALRREQARAHAGRGFTLTPVGDGRVRLSGRLDTEAAATVRAALDPLCTPHPDDRRTATQRRADALVEVCALALHTETLPEHGGDRPQVVVTVPFDVLRGLVGVASLDTGDVLTAEQVRRLACDAQLIPAVLGGRGQVLDLGRARRLVTGPLRRALALRDGGCAFPGCDRPVTWCEVHHVEHWADGGTTSLANLVLLCRRHHRAVHHDGWQIHPGTDGHPDFIPPTHVDPHQRPRRNHHHRHHHRHHHQHQRQRSP